MLKKMPWTIRVTEQSPTSHTGGGLTVVRKQQKRLGHIPNLIGNSNAYFTNANKAKKLAGSSEAPPTSGQTI